MWRRKPKKLIFPRQRRKVRIDMTSLNNMVTLSTLCLLIFIGTDIASSNEYTGLLSRLYKKAAASNRPLVLVLNRDALRPRVRDIPKHSKELASETEDEGVPYVYLYNMAQSQKKPQKVFQQKRLKERQERDEFRDRSYFKEEKGQMKDKRDKQRYLDAVLKPKYKSTLRPPIVQGLLSLRNSLRCGAKNECEDECSNKYSGNKAKSCQVDCEVKYSCEESDPCEKGECESSNECGQSNECSGSTKGVLFITEKPTCKRC